MNKRTPLLVALFTEILLLGTAGFLLAEDDSSAKKNEPLATFQIPKNGDSIVLPVTWKKDYLFILDTGFTLNVVDKTLKNELGKYQNTLNVFTPKETVGVESYEAPPLRLGKVNLPTDGKVLCCDLADVRKAEGREIYGILGMDSLKHFILQIDFDKGEVKFYPPNSKPEMEWGERFAITYNKHECLQCPQTTVVFERLSTVFMIDTGCSGMYIEDALFRQLYFKRQLGITGKTPSVTVAGRMENVSCVLNRFTLGSFEHRNLICDRGNQNRLGLPYLSRYQVTFDFPRNAMYLKKGKRYQEVEHDNMSGLHILQEDKKAVVKIVDADSPAENAGILPEDIILRVDDQDVSKISMFELRNLFKAGDGKKFRLTISRDDKEMEKSLVLKEKIPQWAEPAKE